jgi:integrase
MNRQSRSARSVARQNQTRDYFLRNSRWDDDVWVFTPTTRLEELSQLRVRWNFEVEPGVLFTDPPFAKLLQASKEFVAALLVTTPAGGKGRRAGTAAGYGCLLRRLVKWMRIEKITRYSDIGPDEVRSYISWLRNQRTVRGSPLSKLSMQRYLFCLDQLYRLRASLSDSLQHDPFPGETVGQVLRIKDLDHQRWPYTPDKVAAKLIGAALCFISESERIITARSIYMRVIRFHSDRSSSWQEMCANRALQTRDDLRGTYFAIRTARDLSSAVRLLYAACFVVISYLVGLRRSELITLKYGCVTQRGRGGQEYFAIRGSIFKKEEHYEGRAHEWVAPPSAVEAIEVLEKLSRPLRQGSGRSELWLFARRLAACSALRKGVENVRVFRSFGVNQFLQEFALAVDLRDESGNLWRLSSHQGRKTFARFAALRDRSSFFALAQQLGHRERITTSNGYAGNDYDLEREIGRGIIDQSVGHWESMLAAKHLAGRGGAEITERRPRFRGTRAKEQIAEYAKMLVEAGLVLGICDWGFCVYRKEYSACRGGIGGPNPVEREPSTCARCKNFAVTEEHRPFWREQGERYRALSSAPGIEPQTKQIARERWREARGILDQLDDKKRRRVTDEC